MKITTNNTNLRISKERNEKYQRLSIDLNLLKEFYLDRAKLLSTYLKDLKDAYTLDLKTTLENYIKNPVQDLYDMIKNIETPINFYNSFEINDTLFDIDYPDMDLINHVLTNKNIA